MKKIILVLVFCMFMVGCVSSAQNGALLGGLGGMAGSALGKGDVRTTLLIGAAGTAVGYMLGNEMDKQRQQSQSYHVPPAINYTPSASHSVPMNYTPNYNICRKVTKRFLRDGCMVTTIEDICEDRIINCRIVTKYFFRDGAVVMTKVEEICDDNRYTNTY